MPHLHQPNGPLNPFYDGSTPVAGYSAAPGEAMTAGTGITTGTGTVYQAWINEEGPLTKTTIFVDLTGLNSSAAGDIIGVQATANCHFGQYNFEINGDPVRGRLTCVEVPATGEPDIDVIAADEATGTEDAAYSGLTNDAALVAPGADFAAVGQSYEFTAMPGDNQYLYLSGSGGGTDATYTAGQFLIELWGIKR
ncbi:MAG: hypothetical protein KC438_07140 [Thermomicrobiales bacterium]|nr:hypothetical protein [Thermomicrobiales bacterium]